MADNKDVLRNLPKVYGTEIIPHFQLKRTHHHIVCIVGPPGCGKSETAEMGFREVARSLHLEFKGNPRPEDWTAKKEDGKIGRAHV